MSDDYRWIQRLDDQLQALQLVVAQQGDALAGSQRRVGTLVATIDALVEMLAEAHQLDPQELAARVKAAEVIAHHAKREQSSTSADVWDSAKPPDDVP